MSYTREKIRIKNRYRQTYEGEWIEPIRKGFRQACCDCGMVHIREFRLVKRGNGRAIQFRSFLDNRVTAAKRRSQRHPFRRAKP